MRKRDNTMKPTMQNTPTMLNAMLTLKFSMIMLPIGAVNNG